MIAQHEVQHLMGKDVFELDGDKIGSAGQVYLDDRTGEPEWISVRTGMFGMKESFVPLDEATFVDGRLEIPFGKDMVKGAPKIDPDGDLSPAEEEQLYSYYGLSFSPDRRSGTVDDMPVAVDGGYAAGQDTVGHDASGPKPDDAMTRSEEHLVAGTRTGQSATARLRKYVTTE